jgi:hypothetical protein
MKYIVSMLIRLNPEAKPGSCQLLRSRPGHGPASAQPG